MLPPQIPCGLSELGKAKISEHLSWATRHSASHCSGVGPDSRRSYLNGFQLTRRVPRIGVGPVAGEALLTKILNLYI